MSIYHTFWRRLAAAFIDGIVLYPLTVFDIYMYNTGNFILFYIGIFLSSFLYIIYFIILHAKYGQTLGKKAMQIKVMDIREVDLIGYKRSAIRELPWLIGTTLTLIYMFWFLFILKDYSINNVLQKYHDFNFIVSFTWVILELLSMFTNLKRRAVHDWLAKSVVLKIQN